MPKSVERSVPLAALRWIAGDHVGASSLAIFAHMTGVKPRRGWAHPWDPDDLSRCLRLLRAVPAWRARIPEMARRSKTWKALSARWDEIERCMENEVGWNWSKGKKAPLTYALMKEIIDGAHLKKAA
jgi:hypothetical protein